jgi:hypothetical protein
MSQSPDEFQAPAPAEDHADHWSADDRGATTLEWALLLAAIAIPSYWIIKQSLILLTDYYRMMTTLNGLPFP